MNDDIRARAGTAAAASVEDIIGNYELSSADLYSLKNVDEKEGRPFTPYS